MDVKGMIRGIIYLLFIMLTMYLLVKDKKSSKNKKTNNETISLNPKDKKIALLIVLCTMFMYYIIGYIFKTDIINAITFRKHGISFSFIGIFLLLITSIFIGFIIEVIVKKRKKMQN